MCVHAHSGCRYNVLCGRNMSSQVKSSQVKSSQIQGGRASAFFGSPAGASREGAALRNWHGWIAPSRGA